MKHAVSAVHTISISIYGSLLLSLDIAQTLNMYHESGLLNRCRSGRQCSTTLLDVKDGTICTQDMSTFVDIILYHLE